MNNATANGKLIVIFFNFVLVRVVLLKNFDILIVINFRNMSLDLKYGLLNHFLPRFSHLLGMSKLECIFNYTTHLKS